MPTLLELLSNDEGIQQLLSNTKQVAKGAARGVTTDLAGGPVDLANLVLGALAGKGFGGLTEAPVGGSKSIRGAVGQPTEDTAMEIVGNLLTAILPSPHAAALPEVLIGAIRAGGKPVLNLTHTTKIDKLTERLKGSSTFNSPSFAIAKNDVRPFDAGVDSQVSILANPASPMYDPVVNPFHQLYNRDIFTSRAKDYATQRVNRTYDYDMRAMEGQNPGKLFAIHPDQLDTSQNWGNVASYGHELAIASSPRFHSFAEYEKSQKGAATLTTDKDYVANASRVWEQAFEEVYKGLFGSMRDAGHAPTDLAVVASQAAHSADPAIRERAASVLGALQRLPSTYAELKMGSNLHLGPDTVTAIIAQPGTSRDKMDKLQALIKDVPVGQAKDFVPKEFQQRYTDLADMLAGKVRKAKQSGELETGSNYNVLRWLESQNLGRYGHGNPPLLYSLSDAAYTKLDTDEQRAMHNNILNGGAFESDVASYLNSLKLDK